MNETDTLISSYLSSQLFFKNEVKDILSSVHGVDAGNIYSTYGNTIRALSGNFVLNTNAKHILSNTLDTNLSALWSLNDLSTVTDLSISSMDKFLYWFCQRSNSIKNTYMTNLTATWINGELQQ